MSNTETITVTNYAVDRFARLEATLATKGLKLTGDSGEVHDFGADVKFNYDPEALTLTLAVLHGPHFHSFDDFAKSLETFVENQK